MTTADTVAAFGTFGILGGIFLGILYALCPLIIMWQLGGVKTRLDKARKAHSQADQQAIEYATTQLQASTELIREQKAGNALMRQLLRTYGHEPEA